MRYVHLKLTDTVLMKAISQSYLAGAMSMLDIKLILNYNKAQGLL